MVLEWLSVQIRRIKLRKTVDLQHKIFLLLVALRGIVQILCKAFPLSLYSVQTLSYSVESI